MIHVRGRVTKLLDSMVDEVWEAPPADALEPEACGAPDITEPPQKDLIYRIEDLLAEARLNADDLSDQFRIRLLEALEWYVPGVAEVSEEEKGLAYQSGYDKGHEDGYEQAGKDRGEEARVEDTDELDDDESSE